MKSSEIIRLVQTNSLASELKDANQFAKDISFIIKTSFSPYSISALPDSFWKQEIPYVVSLKKMMEEGDVMFQEKSPLGPVEYLREILREKIHQQAALN